MLYSHHSSLIGHPVGRRTVDSWHLGGFVHVKARFSSGPVTSSEGNLSTLQPLAMENGPFTDDLCYLSNMVIFHGYGKLPEGNLWWGEGVGYSFGVATKVVIFANFPSSQVQYNSVRTFFGSLTMSYN
jgi:hypothetical protein